MSVPYMTAVDSSLWQKHCPDLYVEFPVTRLAEAEVLWINERFFLERNVDVSDPAIAARSPATAA